MRSAAHQEFNKAEILSGVVDNIKDGKDIFGRNASFRLVEIDDTYPEYLRNHLSEYDFLILKKEGGAQKALRHTKSWLREKLLPGRQGRETHLQKTDREGMREMEKEMRQDKRPKVSICIPAYNNEAEVRRLLSSIAAQTMQDVEIILTDDSTNGGDRGAGGGDPERKKCGRGSCRHPLDRALHEPPALCAQ